MKKIVSYENVLKILDANKKRDDIFWRGQKPIFQMISYKNESYSEFLRRNPTSTKKQRILAIQRFYNHLL